MSDPKDAQENLEKLKAAVRRYFKAFLPSERKSSEMALDALMMELDAPENRCPTVFTKGTQCQFEAGHGHTHRSGHIMWSESKTRKKS